MSMKWINAKDLENWASTRDCQESLPLVVRRLIWATVNGINSIVFPAGDSVNLPGWDGILESSQETEYIPKGLSLWEIGTNKNVKAKVEEDYQKRKQNPLGFNPSEATFIFVTPRIWSGKDEWISEKKEEKFWKSIKVYDATILEEWLEQAPAVGAWLAKSIGKYPQGVLSVEDWWIEWSQVTTPSLVPELVLAGRKNQVESIKEWMSSSPFLKIIQAPTKDEAIAFIAALIYTLPEREKNFYLSKSIVILNLKSFRHITTTCKKGLLLIPQFEETEKAIVASQQGHHVYIPIGPDNTVSTEKLVLPRLGREEFISALSEKMGISEENAEKYSNDTARSLSVLRRLLSPASKQPEWAKPDIATQFLPVLLAGKWEENKEKDKEIIKKLAETSYENFTSSLAKWLYKPDTPILKIGERWRLVSPLDAFFALAPFITKSDLDKFKKILLEVLASEDPAVELEPEKRWMASVYGKEPIHSKTLREGITQTLVLIGIFGDNAKIDISCLPQTWVDSVVRELLDKANWQLWYSLSDVLPLIAEASPLSFLDAVENSLSQDPPPLIGMFTETEDVLTSPSKHSSLLWALEALAWNPMYLGRVTLILAKLAKLDPGGKSANRPIDSLRTIFLLWLPNTYADLEQRFLALDMLIEKEPDVGWNLLIELMPRDFGIYLPNYKTRCRQFSKQIENRVTMAEHLKSISKLIERILANVGNNGKKWEDIIEHFSDLSPNDRTKVLKKLSESVDAIQYNRLELWNKLRNILSDHRSFPDAQWVLPKGELKEIEEIYNRRRPQDEIEQNLWLFDDFWPNPPQGTKKRNYKETEKIITQSRIKAVQSIKNQDGLNGLIKIASRTKNPSLVGVTTAEIHLTDKEEQILFSLLDGEDENKIKFAQSYIEQKALKSRGIWIDKLLEIVSSQRCSTKKIVNLFLALPQNRKVWNLLEKFGTQIKNAYWKKISLRLFDLPKEDKIYSLQMLNTVGRNFTALKNVAYFAKDLPPKLVADLLEKAALEKSIDDPHIVAPGDIEELFKVFDEPGEVGKEEIAKLEWLYLPVLAGVGSNRPPKMLHNELSSNPEFFSRVIKYLYKPRNEDKREGKEDLAQELRKQTAHYAWRLLYSWKTVPGSDSSGKINYESLKSWVYKARELCKRLDRIEVCDNHIGQVLAYAVPDENNNWPPQEVCRIIDEVRSSKLDTGFIIGNYNKREIVWKNPFEGGKKERTLANQFREYADRWSIQYPRTSSVLTKIAEDYENEAKLADQEAEKEGLDW